MTQINQNFDKYNNVYTAKDGVSHRAQQPQTTPQINIPGYYYVPESYANASAMEIIRDNPVYEMLLKPFIEHPFALLGTWLGLSWGLDQYKKACSGKYEDSLLKKAANFGDKIQESSIVQSKPIQTIISSFNKAGNKGGNIVENNSVLKAMRDMSSLPELPMVKSQMFSHKQEVVQDFVKIADALKLDGNGFAQLKDLGLTKAEKEMLYKAFNVSSLSQVAEDKASNYLLLQRLGRDEKQINKILNKGNSATELTKKEILKELGLTSSDIKKIREDMFGNHIKKVEEATGKVGNRIRIGGGHYNWMGIATKPFERTIGCDEIHNRLYSLSDGARTATGRFTSKLMQMSHDCLTFRQGKLAALIFIAPILIETAMNVKKADKDQKVGTAVGGLIESTSWIVTWPIALRLMHKFGGAQYAGMTKEQVEEYRKLVNDFNNRASKTIKVNGEKQANPNMFKSKAEYDEAKTIVQEKLKKLRTVNGQGFFTKTMRNIARFFTMDLEVLKGCNSGSALQNFGSKLPNAFRNIGGVPMRLAVFFGLAMGVLDGTISKIISKVFGKSYDSMKQDERKADRKAQQQFLFDDLNQRMYEAQAKKQGYNIQTQAPNQNIAMRGAMPAHAQIPEQEEPIDNYTYIPSPINIIPHPKNSGKLDNYSYIPSSENVIKPENDEQNPNKRSYIPSQEPANIQKTFDNSGLEGALRRADRAEQRAMQVLAGNFENL